MADRGPSRSYLCVIADFSLVSQASTARWTCTTSERPAELSDVSHLESTLLVSHTTPYHIHIWLYPVSRRVQAVGRTKLVAVLSEFGRCGRVANRAGPHPSKLTHRVAH